jgi:hypothetical protein
LLVFGDAYIDGGGFFPVAPTVLDREQASLHGTNEDRSGGHSPLSLSGSD